MVAEEQPGSSFYGDRYRLLEFPYEGIYPLMLPYVSPLQNSFCNGFLATFPLDGLNFRCRTDRALQFSYRTLQYACC